MKKQKQNRKIKREMFFPILIFFIGMVVLGTLGYHYRKNQNSLLRSKAELNVTTYAEHMRLNIIQGIQTTSTLE